MDQATVSPKIRFVTESRLTAITAAGKGLSALICHIPSASDSQMIVDRILIRIGTQPNSELFKGQLEVDEDGYLAGEMVIQGVFAAGDLTRPTALTISTAVGQGAVAARAAAEYIYNV
jgi:thioredoxin reductase (NADPH)